MKQYGYFNTPLLREKIVTNFIFLIDKGKFIFYDSYYEICEKNSFHSIERVKLYNYLDTKQVLTFEKRGEGRKIKNLTSTF